MAELRILGPRALLRRDGAEVRSVLRQPKRLALLCYLSTVAHGSYVRREEVLALLWPDNPDRRARASLSEALSRLRQSLGEGIILTRGSDEVGVAADALWCDAVAFHEAVRDGRREEAVELYRGDFLDGFSTNVGDRFAEWARDERERSRRLAIDAVSHLADQAVSDDDLTAMQWAERALTLAPLDDAAARRLMQLQATRGHRASALDVFDGLRARLAAEGLEPTPETVELARRIRAGEFETRLDPYSDDRTVSRRRPKALEPFAGLDRGALLAAMSRKRVYQTGIAYSVSALALAGGAEVAAHAFHWPEQMLRAVVTGLATGLPVAIVSAWFLELRIPDEAVLHPRRLSAGAMALLTLGLAVLTATVVIETDGPVFAEVLVAPDAVGAAAAAGAGENTISPSASGQRPPAVPDPFLRLMVDFSDFLGPTRSATGGWEGFITRQSPDGSIVGSGVVLAEIDEGEAPGCSINRRVAVSVDENPEFFTGTWLAGQSRLTLVLPCDPWAVENRQPVVGEYLAYSAYSALTEVSLEARLGGVTLIDSEWRGSRNAATAPDSVTTLALLVESPRSLASRHDAALFDGPQVHPNRLSPSASALVELFQYMIGNTQYSMPYLYNIDVLRRGEELIPVPNGFRYAGIIDPTTPTDPALPISAAGERHFRGFCREDGHYSAVEVVAAARDSVYGLYMNQAYLDARRQATALLFLNRLFDELADAGRTGLFLTEACRALTSTGDGMGVP